MLIGLTKSNDIDPSRICCAITLPDELETTCSSTILSTMNVIISGSVVSKRLPDVNKATHIIIRPKNSIKMPTVFSKVPIR